MVANCNEAEWPTAPGVSSAIDHFCSRFLISFLQMVKIMPNVTK